MNVLLLGRDYINPEYLYNGPTESVYKAENGNDVREQRRDISKYYIKDGKVVALFGIENQSTIDNAMPIRVMGYDYSSYRGQMMNRENHYPVITVVLNFEEKKWNKPIALEDIFECPRELEEHIGHDKIKIVNVAYIPKEVRKNLKSDFRVIADFFTEKRETGTYRPGSQRIEHEMAVLHMLKVFTKDERYEEIEKKIKERKEKGEVITMCTFADEMENRGIEKGLKQGRIVEAISIYREEMNLHEETILEKIMQKFGLSMGEAESYIL